MLKSPSQYQEMADPQVQPRYTGIATFFRAPFTEDLVQAEIGIIGVPFDGGVTNRSGTRLGPRAVRDQSTLLRTINTATGIAPFAIARVRDLGDCWIEKPFELQAAHQEISALYGQVIAAGVIPISVGGDHSISLPILRAVGAAHPVGLVQIDAHCDTGGDYMGSRFHHGAPFSRAVEEGLLDPKRTIQIGIRGTTNHPDLWRFSAESGMRILPMDELQDKGWRFAADEVLRVVGDGPVYLSFDIDAIDPAQAPGTGTPEAGGISIIDALRLLRAIRGIDFIGADLVEVSPPFDVGGITAFNAAAVLFEVLCLLTEAHQVRT
ncbi:MAG: agmatinase [Acetobacteraceae bacterium]|nr:agmatinase [Acetobacteraceae bacterium]MBV8522367.1 agmatinase [Acetobacteraceae bacterium]MBV8588477.1 agmatinase [Acetobacteraceae bacterium]